MTGFLVKSKTTIPNILDDINWIYLIPSLHHGIAILPGKIERANTTCPPSWKCHALILCLKLGVFFRGGSRKRPCYSCSMESIINTTHH